MKLVKFIEENKCSALRTDRYEGVIDVSKVAKGKRCDLFFNRVIQIIRDQSALSLYAEISNSHSIFNFVGYIVRARTFPAKIPLKCK